MAWTRNKTSPEGWKVTHQANWKCNSQHFLRLTHYQYFSAVNTKWMRSYWSSAVLPHESWKSTELSEWLERWLVHSVCLLVSCRSEYYWQNVILGRMLELSKNRAHMWPEFTRKASSAMNAKNGDIQEREVAIRSIRILNCPQFGNLARRKGKRIAGNIPSSGEKVQLKYYVYRFHVFEIFHLSFPVMQLWVILGNHI